MLKVFAVQTFHSTTGTVYHLVLWSIDLLNFVHKFGIKQMKSYGAFLKSGGAAAP